MAIYGHTVVLCLSLSRSTRNLNAWMCGCLDRRQPNSSQSTYYSVSTNSKFPPQCLEFLTEVLDCAPLGPRSLARSLRSPFPSLPFRSSQIAWAWLATAGSIAKQVGPTQPLACGNLSFFPSPSSFSSLPPQIDRTVSSDTTKCLSSRQPPNPTGGESHVTSGVMQPTGGCHASDT